MTRSGARTLFSIPPKLADGRVIGGAMRVAKRSARIEADEPCGRFGVAPASSRLRELDRPAESR